MFITTSLEQIPETMSRIRAWFTDLSHGYVNKKLFIYLLQFRVVEEDGAYMNVYLKSVRFTWVSDYSFDIESLCVENEAGTPLITTLPLYDKNHLTKAMYGKATKNENSGQFSTHARGWCFHAPSEELVNFLAVHSLILVCVPCH